MNVTSWPVRFFLMLLLLACIMVLAKYILFKNYGWNYHEYLQKHISFNNYKKGLQAANLEPFKTIKLMQSRNVAIAYRVENVGGNIVGFLPLGVLFPMLFTGMRKVWKTVMFIFFISLAFELVQLFTSLGVFDVDDLILNTAGGVLGYVLYKTGCLLFGR